MKLRWLLAVLLLGGASLAWAGESTKQGPRPPAAAGTKDAQPVLVPYRLIDTHHVMVRIKINGKGPFNFIVDTGCPVLIVSTPVAKKVGLETDGKGWAVL